jgi:hypothetical protein
MFEVEPLTTGCIADTVADAVRFFAGQHPLKIFEHSF